MTKPENTASAEMLRIQGTSDDTEWLVRVEYEFDYYLVLMKGDLVQVYNERELPDSRGETMRRPTHVTSHRAAAIECVRRIRHGYDG
jgi:hypothetical protein